MYTYHNKCQKELKPYFSLPANSQTDNRRKTTQAKHQRNKKAEPPDQATSRYPSLSLEIRHRWLNFLILHENIGCWVLIGSVSISGYNKNVFCGRKSVFVEEKEIISTFFIRMKHLLQDNG